MTKCQNLFAGCRPIPYSERVQHHYNDPRRFNYDEAKTLVGEGKSLRNVAFRFGLSEWQTAKYLLRCDRQTLRQVLENETKDGDVADRTVPLVGVNLNLLVEKIFEKVDESIRGRGIRTAAILTHEEAIRYVKLTSKRAFSDWVQRWAVPTLQGGRYSVNALDLALAREGGFVRVPASVRNKQID